LSDYSMTLDWLAEIRKRTQILSRQGKSLNKRTVFTISSTSKTDPSDRPYLTPLRENPGELVSGVVVRTLDQGALAAWVLEGVVDRVYVDAEAKKGIKTEHDAQLFLSAGVPTLEGYLKGKDWVGTTLPEVCFPYFKNSEARIFKPNDLTVESVWFFLMEKKPAPGVVVILGAGNIGFKLGLKLVETGYNVAMVRRDKSALQKLVDTIELVKPPHSPGKSFIPLDLNEILSKADVVLGCSDGTPVITEDIVKIVPKDCLILDVGKGTFSRLAVKEAHHRNLEIYRTDITSGLDGFLVGAAKNHQILHQELGRKEIEPGLAVVSGGFLGRENDVIVDNFLNPRMIIGVADGLGDLIRELSLDQEKRIKKVKEVILERMQENIRI